MSARASSGKGNRRLAIGLVSVVGGMLGLAYASVPLYDLFCRVTGYGGTTRVADAAPVEIGDYELTVRFNADTQSALPWRFAPVERSVTVRAGESKLAFYRAENLGDTPLVGTATFNVTPQVAGAYFNKIDCFCFEEQYLAPGATAELPVSFFVDPAIADDPDTAHIRTITLSYMFFDAGGEALARYVSAETDAGSSLN
jgi:cytochrome c oxidase assembly protein subunit 11